MKLLLRAKLLTLSGVLALGGLTAVAAPAALACSNSDANPPCPPLNITGGPGQVVVGSPDNVFWPGATVRIEALDSPGLQQVRATDMVIVDPCGHLSLDSTVCNSGPYRLDVNNYVGAVQIMADQFAAAATKTHPAFPAIVGVAGQGSVAPLSTLTAYAQGPAGVPPQCGVEVFGNGFGLPGPSATQGGQQVDVQVFDNMGNQQGQTQTVQVYSGGKIAVTSGLNFSYTGPGQVKATPRIVGQPVSVNLNLCSAMPIPSGGGGGGTISGGSTGGSGGGGITHTGGHAAE
jgi:hypothetical protein